MVAYYSDNTNSRKASVMAPACTSASSFRVILWSTVAAVLIFIALASLIIDILPLALFVLLFAIAIRRANNRKIKVHDAEI